MAPNFSLLQFFIAFITFCLYPTIFCFFKYSSSPISNISCIFVISYFSSFINASNRLSTDNSIFATCIYFIVLRILLCPISSFTSNILAPLSIKSVANPMSQAMDYKFIIYFGLFSISSKKYSCSFYR